MKYGLEHNTGSNQMLRINDLTSRNNAVGCVTRVDLISIQTRHKFPKQVSVHNLVIACARLWELNVTVNCVRLLLYIAKAASVSVLLSRVGPGVESSLARVCNALVAKAGSRQKSGSKKHLRKALQIDF